MTEPYFVTTSVSAKIVNPEELVLDIPTVQEDVIISSLDAATSIIRNFVTNMPSNQNITKRALKEGNVDALKTVIPNADKKILDALRALATLPGNPLQDAGINQALNNMLAKCYIFKSSILRNSGARKNVLKTTQISTFTN